VADDYELTVEPDPDDDERGLQRLGALLLDLRPFWPKVVPIFVGWMRRQFETEGAWAGHPWAPLSPAYAARKARMYGPGKGILVAEGDLRKAASFPIRHATPTSLTLEIDWARYKGEDVRLSWHQHGTERMPARPLLFDFVPPEGKMELDEAADEYAEEMIRRAGL
jgi:hypothetical protein